MPRLLQKGYDVLYNQFIFGTEQSNNPFGFYSPTGNQRDEPLKIKNGYLYPTTDPSSVNIVKLPPPDMISHSPVPAGGLSAFIVAIFSQFLKRY